LGGKSGVPVFHGPLAFESGPERIETGWWDGRDIRRDYYVARNPRGMRVWIFNDRHRGDWYLHGLFG
jgi:protein ImuB